MIKADLHFHSTASDGHFAPEELVERAHENGAELLALTDHDTLSGLSAAQRRAQELGIEFVPGVEFSCVWNGVGIHIVGLGFDLDNLEIQSAVNHQTMLREERAMEIGRRLDKLGMENSYEKAKQVAGEGQIGRPHFAKLLVTSGKVKDLNQAFKKHLGAGKTGDVKALWPEINQAIKWIHAANGYAVLAHPDKYKLTKTKLKKLLTDFKVFDGDAIEVISGRQTPEQTRYFQKACQEFDFYASCGSDFHGPDTRWNDIAKVPPLPEGCQPIWRLWQ